MADVAKRLAGPVVGTGAEATLYTVPTATTGILRDISVANTTTTRQTFKLTIGADAAGTRIYQDVPVDPGIPFEWNGFRVMAAAETLRWNGPSTLTIMVNGVEVS
jgi:hypothetical protein